jgi:2-deoxy-D-gluconate 3-dehydrogenase
VRRFTLDRCKAYIDQQAYFGGRNVLLVAGEYYCDLQVFSKEQIFGLVAENLRELAEHAEPQGIELAIELEPFKHAVASSVHELADLIRLVDHPAVKANADVSHLQLSGASFDEVAVLTGMIGHVHVSDCDRQGAWRHAAGSRRDADQGVPAGDPRHGYTGTVSVELERVPEPDPDGRAGGGVLSRDGADPRRARSPRRRTVAGPFDLSGRRALVTGGGGGIGRGIARALVDAGAHLAILGRSDSAEEAAAELGGIAVRGRPHRPHALRGWVRGGGPRAGRGWTSRQLARDRSAPDAVGHDLAAWDEVIEVNLTATFELCQLGRRIMVAQGSGHDRGTSRRVMSYQGGLPPHVYAASKRRLAADDGACERVGSLGVNVNRDRPRLRQDRANARIWRDDPERTEQFNVRIPAGRWG